ncbi:hypothetical protein AS9A_P20052 (plasmid) [Hoyosella subflava DQS3-9A1]|uniref:Uncharacterized protein n=1 Tax=Hoyosella subflava (strain DSM 45089 / JCM 17490 / NBRC 109087 / DQS3-9A1) TaxID=443218 RepID=F6ESH5_HOYSD|nr:hypothetical protein AS9A_P20052 [Hoyosella subflava DQS3-9A1]
MCVSAAARRPASGDRRPHEINQELIHDLVAAFGGTRIPEHAHVPSRSLFLSSPAGPVSASRRGNRGSQ